MKRRFRKLIYWWCHSNLYPAILIGAVMRGMDRMVFSSLVFWFGLLLVPAAALLPDLVVTVWVPVSSTYCALARTHRPASASEPGRCSSSTAAKYQIRWRFTKLGPIAHWGSRVRCRVYNDVIPMLKEYRDCLYGPIWTRWKYKEQILGKVMVRRYCPHK